MTTLYPQPSASASASPSTITAASDQPNPQPHNRGLRPSTIRNAPANGSHQFGSRQVNNDEVSINSPSPIGSAPAPR